jgi:small subunit ribosomal protein S3
VGQKVHPLGFRLGIFESWGARWYAKGSYGKELLEDFRIRRYLGGRLNKADISSIVIEKAVENVRIIIFALRPGLIIGKKGMGVEAIKKDLASVLKKNIEISVQEIKRPDIDAKIVAQNIAEMLERRASFKRLIKRAGYAAMKSGAKGIKICCSGRLAGSEIARSEWLRLGSVPLHTLRANVDFSLAEAKTVYGMIGVKVWICRGEY